MKIENMKIVLTGAAGGIGRVLSQQLIAKGGKLAIIDRDPDQLSTLAESLDLVSHGGMSITADLGSPEGLDIIKSAIREKWGGVVDIVIHAAGVMDFAPFDTMQSESIHRITSINMEAPIQLTRTLLPGMLLRGSGRIVFIGSILGGLGLPYFSTYTASKFALRGFSEALRREVHGSGIGISYIGPRSVKTRLNAGAVERMAEATGMKMDDPGLVAARVVRMIEKEQNEVHLGFPEALFVRLNALLPRMVDMGMRGQQKVMKLYADGKA